MSPRHGVVGAVGTIDRDLVTLQGNQAFEYAVGVIDVGLTEPDPGDLQLLTLAVVHSFWQCLHMSIQEHVKQMRDPRWWDQFSPLSVSSSTFDTSAQPSQRAGQAFRDGLRKEGWAQWTPPDQRERIGLLREGVLALRAERLPGPFMWMFEDTWRFFASLDPLFRVAMGRDYKVLPCFWAWYVAPGAEHGGWPVHRDRTRGERNVGPDGLPKTLSVWVPLTRATPHNGCMHVVPSPYAPASGKDIRPRDIRCLPAEPGDVLSWRQDLFHWGGRSSDIAGGPRIALGLELQGRTSHAFERPLYEPGHIPSFEHRLALVGQNLWRYRGRLKNKRISELAQGLMAIAPDLDNTAVDAPKSKQVMVAGPLWR
ncbi:MAG: hypothetical protein ACI9MC_002065 [Kiritimatiellia bacterium]